MSTLTARTPTPAAETSNVTIDCGWGRLIIGETFADAHQLVETLVAEREGQRDVALYVDEPHVVLSLAPQELFLDPSHTYRLDLEGPIGARTPPGVEVRPIEGGDEATQFRDVMRRAQLVPPRDGFLESERDTEIIVTLAAFDRSSGKVLGCVTGVDHVMAYNDDNNGSSLWGLATDPQAPHPGIGETLVQGLATLFQERGRSRMDLSVIHDNESAIALYEKLNFKRAPVFCIKRKNPINEPLFVGKPVEEELNVYSRIIVEEARRRGIGADIIDAQAGFFRLSLGGRSVVCRESLSELTSAVAMSRCDNKAVTRRILERADLRVPAQQKATDGPEDLDFLRTYKRIVVKQARGEQGIGVYIDIRGEDEMRRAIASARTMCPDVILEEFVEGEDLRVIVIDDRVVAAAIRRPATIVGDGTHTAASLIKTQSRRREAATQGESSIPLDQETERCVREAGYGMEDVIPQGVQVAVRKTANLHTGGTIHDVTDILSQTLCNAAREAAKAIEIPVTGIDFIVSAPDADDYVIIEANERPGLANHEPQPTAERFIDFLFPQSARERR